MNTAEGRWLEGLDEPQPKDCPDHEPLDDDGGCAGCVAEDRATDAWEERVR